jgi:hypothetical protein
VLCIRGKGHRISALCIFATRNNMNVTAYNPRQSRGLHADQVYYLAKNKGKPDILRRKCEALMKVVTHSREGNEAHTASVLPREVGLPRSCRQSQLLGLHIREMWT